MCVRKDKWHKKDKCGLCVRRNIEQVGESDLYDWVNFAAILPGSCSIRQVRVNAAWWICCLWSGHMYICETHGFMASCEEISFNSMSPGTLFQWCVCAKPKITCLSYSDIQNKPFHLFLHITVTTPEKKHLMKRVCLVHLTSQLNIKRFVEV